jgi:SAM-dependent methyltransferase
MKNFRSNLRDMTGTNIELGKFHLRCGNYTDAIIRFLLVTKYLDRGNKVANYWLGWTYFLKNNHRKALIALEQSEIQNDVDLYNFIRDIDNISEVPSDIHRMYRDIKATVFIDKFASESVNISVQAITEFNKLVTGLPEHYSILELGCNIGLLGLEIRKRMQESFDLKGVETSAELIKLQSLYSRTDETYDEIIQSDIIEFLEYDKTSYDIIMSIDGLSSSSNPEKVLSLIADHLNSGGHFLIIFKTSAITKFVEKYLEYSYNNQTIVKIFEQLDLKLNSQLKINLEIKNNYSIFMGTKN